MVLYADSADFGKLKFLAAGQQQVFAVLQLTGLACSACSSLNNQ